MGKHAQTHTLPIETLKTLGLSQNEAELYSLLMTNPRASVKTLQSLTPFPRTLLYYILGQLEQRGLVSSTKVANKTAYSAQNPERLYDLLHEREQTFVEHKRAVEQLIPELKHQFQRAQNRPGIRSLEGITAYRSALMNLLLENSTIYSWVDPNTPLPGTNVREDLHKQRLKKGIEQRILAKDGPKSAEFKKQFGSARMTPITLLPESFPLEAAELHITDTTLMYVTRAEHEPIITLIHDQQLATLQKTLFDQQWNSLTNA